MSNIKKLLGLKIKEYRKSCNMTQEQLAERVGIGTPNISYIENGKFSPSVETLEKLADIFGIKPYELYMFEHLKPASELKAELINAIENDENLLRLIYKFYSSIK